MTGDSPATAGPTRPSGKRFELPARRTIWLSATVLAIAVLAVVVALVSCGGAQRQTGATGPRPDSADGNSANGDSANGSSANGRGGPTKSSGAGKPHATGTPSSRGGASAPEYNGTGDVKCPAATVRVTDARSLTAALSAATAGTSIWMENGVYAGRFEATASGAAQSPIFLCGGAGAVIDGGGIKGGYAFHLKGASYWRLVGFTIRNGQKGLMADTVRQVVIQALTVEEIGDEGIHLRAFSSDNIVQGNTVRRTGLRRDKFGEGIYIGTAQSNWCTNSGCKPDLSDRNIVRGNNISETTAESIDIKEGTTGGVVVDNTFDGSTLREPGADSWIDVKGNGWVIQGNVGRNAPMDGFQTHEVASGWGTDNVFKANTAEVNGPGWGFHFAPVNGNKVSCDNKVVGAAKGLANVDCV